MYLRNLSLKRVWPMINIMQIVTNIQTMNIIFPSNAFSFVTMIKDMLSLKILNF